MTIKEALRLRKAYYNFMDGLDKELLSFRDYVDICEFLID